MRQNHQFKQYVKGAGVTVCIEVSKLDAKEFVGFLTLYVYVVAPGEIFREIQSKIFEL